MPTKRLFLGIKIIPEPKLIETIEKLKSAFKAEKIKWVELENIHITLSFIGDVAVEKINTIISILHQINTNYNNFEISLGKLGVFDNYRNPKVLWVGISPFEAIHNLADEINLKLLQMGFAIDNRQFKPHLTIARIKEICNIDLFKKQILSFDINLIQTCFIQEFILFESRLKPNGPLYIPIEIFRLHE